MEHLRINEETIDRYCAKLSINEVGLLQEFSKNKTNAERIKYLLNLQKTSNVNIWESTVITTKNEKLAVNARNKGNELFCVKNYEEALQSYNKCLCLAPAGSVTISLAYANRSAIYFRAQMWSVCLENIDLAIKNGYPENLKSKLMTRRDECLKNVLNEKKPAEIQLNLSHPANPKIPFAIDALQLQKDDKVGRYIVTTKHLKAGDLVLIEESFVNEIHHDAVYTCCNYCLQKNDYNLIPSPFANSVMFCSEKCANEAWERSFKYEYPIIDVMLEQITETFISGLRQALRCFTLFESPDELKTFIESIDIEKENAFAMDYNCCDEKSKLRIFYGMETNESRRTAKNLFTMSHFAASIYCILMKFTEFKNVLKTAQHENLFLELFQRFSQILAVNGHETSVPMMKKDEMNLDKVDGQSLGTGVSFIFSLMNHNCSPNTMRISIPGKTLVYIIVPIKAGQQLFENYGYRYNDCPKPERHYGLKLHYQFDCHCNACEKDYLMQHLLQFKKFISSKEATEINHENTYAQFEKSTRKKVINLLNKYAHFHPCIETFICEIYLMSSIASDFVRPKIGSV